MKRISPILLAIMALFLIAGSDKRPVPQSSVQVRTEMAEALESGDRIAVTQSAIELAQMGGSLSEASLARIEPLLDEAMLGKVKWLDTLGTMPRSTLLITRLRSNGTVAAGHQSSAPFVEVPAEYRLVEGIAFDRMSGTSTGRLFIGTVVEGRLAYLDVSVAPSGMGYGPASAAKWTEIDIGFPRGGLFGMGIDQKRRLLWIATGSVEQTAIAGERMTGLIAVDLDRLVVVRRVPVAGLDAGVAGDLTIAGDGTVYVSNAKTGAIHRCRPGCTALEDLVPAGVFKNPQGLVLSKDGRTLFVADYRSGLWAVDVRKGVAKPVRVKYPAMLDGIDGMKATTDFLGRDRLIAIQNGTNPRRVIEIVMVRGGWAYVSELDRISAIGPEPTLGTFDGGNAFLFIADGQWERYGAGGGIKDDSSPRPTSIRVLDLAEIVIT